MIKQSNNLIIATIIIVIGLSIGYSIVASAQTAPDIVFPIEELGNCANETDCKNFCDKPANMIPCVNFAERNGLISKEELKKAKSFIQAGMKGPGGCRGKEECETFCDNSANMEICINFAKENGLMSEEELQEAEKVAKALREGAKMPGNCKNKKECESYCDNPDNMEECLAFAEAAGFIPENELAEAKKAMKAMKSGIKPPGNCRGKKQCESYCDNPDNMEECLAFAEAAGFIPPEEIEMAKKMMPLMKAGRMPGGCRGKEECEAYCVEDNHMEECASFAIEAGIMKPEEAEMFRKTGGKGPGDCKGKVQCEAFCNDPANQETCFNFAKDRGLIPPEEIERMKQGMNQMRQMMGEEGGPMIPGIPGEPGHGAGMPPEIAQCLKSTVGEEVFDKMQGGRIMPSQQVGEQMRKCFEQFMPQDVRQPQEQMNPQEGMMPPQNFIKPDGFKQPEGFQPPQEMNIPEQYREIYKQQYDQQYKQMMPPDGTIPPQGIMPPEGFKPPETLIPYRNMIPEGMITPPEYIKPQEGMIVPQEIMPYSPPPTETTPMELGSNLYNNFLNLFKKIFSR